MLWRIYWFRTCHYYTATCWILVRFEFERKECLQNWKQKCDIKTNIGNMESLSIKTCISVKHNYILYFVNGLTNSLFIVLLPQTFMQEVPCWNLSLGCITNRESDFSRIANVKVFPGPHFSHSTKCWRWIVKDISWLR